MWEQIYQLAANSGIWALLFVTLFFIQLKESKTREDKYQSTIDSLAEKLGIVGDIKDDVKAIMEKFKD